MDIKLWFCFSEFCRNAESNFPLEIEDSTTPKQIVNGVIGGRGVSKDKVNDLTIVFNSKWFNTVESYSPLKRGVRSAYNH